MEAATTSGRLEAFRAIPLFSTLSDASLARVIDLAAEAEAPAGQVLIEPGREGSGLFVIEEGTVACELPGRTIELGPGEFVGELALLTPDAVRSARVQARTPVRFLAIARADFERLIVEEPALALSMLRALAERLLRDIS